jgi:uncharacterized protein YlaN (UPF0358 family)
MAKKLVNGLKEVGSLVELLTLARGNERFAKLAKVAAENLGMPNGSLDEALRSLEIVAMETDEDGVMGEVNFVRDLVN